MIMIIKTVMIMNVEYIFLPSLNAPQTKVSSAVAYDSINCYTAPARIFRLFNHMDAEHASREN